MSEAVGPLMADAPAECDAAKQAEEKPRYGFYGQAPVPGTRDPRGQWLNDVVMVQSLASPRWTRTGLLVDYGEGWVLLEVQYARPLADSKSPRMITVRELVFVGPGVSIHRVIRE